MDEDLSRVVTDVFVRLYDDGLIYRGKRLGNWDPTLHTAVSDLEVVTEQEHGKLKPAAPGAGSPSAPALSVGDKVEIVPSHGCTTINLHDLYHVTRAGILEAIWPIAGRGKTS